RARADRGDRSAGLAILQRQHARQHRAGRRRTIPAKRRALPRDPALPRFAEQCAVPLDRVAAHRALPLHHHLPLRPPLVVVRQPAGGTTMWRTHWLGARSTRLPTAAASPWTTSATQAPPKPAPVMRAPKTSG